MMNQPNIRSRRYLALGLLLLLLLALFVPSATALSYAFYVPELKMQVYVQPDGSARDCV